MVYISSGAKYTTCANRSKRRRNE